jgi:hypothetical protein
VGMMGMMRNVILFIVDIKASRRGPSIDLSSSMN